MAKKKDNVLAVVTHLIVFFSSFIGPLVIYFVTEDDFVKKNAAKALNWQISAFIYLLISAVLVLVVIGFLFLLILGIIGTVFPIIAAVKASEGEAWDYPLSIPFIKT